MKKKNRFAFTRAKLSALPTPKTGWSYYYDDSVRGLALAVSAHETEPGKPTRSFLVYRKFNGRPTKVALGFFDPNLPENRDMPENTNYLDLLGNRPALNVTMAKKAAEAVNSELNRGVNPAREKRAARHKARHEMTLGELFALYRDDRLSHEKKTVGGMCWAFERYLGELPDVAKKKHGRLRTKPVGSVNWQRRAISEITTWDVSRLQHALGANSGWVTANRVVQLVRALYNWARTKKLFGGVNPADKEAGIVLFKESPRKRFVRSEELPKFFAALDAQDDRDFADYIRLSIFVGARRNNLLRMRWDELTLDVGARWTIPGVKMKNGDPLEIPLVLQALEILRRRKVEATGAWVFAGRTKAGHAGAFRKPWARLLKDAGFPDLHIHDLRRTFGSYLNKAGVTTATTMEAMGHKSVEAALRYQQADLSDARNAMQMTVDGIERLARGKKAPVFELRPGGARKLSKAGR
jgi:integrase